MKATMRTAMMQTLVLAKIGGELGHAAFRTGGALALGALLLLARLFGQFAGGDGVAIGVAAYAAFSAIWLLIVARSLLTYRARRLWSVVLDQVMFAVALYFGGTALAPLMWAPVVMVIGNGLRYGACYAHLSTAVGVVSIAIATHLSPAWYGTPLLTTGLVMAIVMLPLYVHLLATQIERVKHDLSVKASHFESASKTDSLTGILNRAGFFQALQAMLGQARAQSLGAAVMLLDLDGFKVINDQCGHTRGDAVLREVAFRIRYCLREGDVVARLGGDEFGIALSLGCAQRSPERLAQDLVDAVASVPVPGRPDLHLGASVGMCRLPDPHLADIDAVMEEADRLMYEAKRGGKNRFRSSGDTAAAGR
jgi:diguanylate cyclase (GGDEF)-like protein